MARSSFFFGENKTNTVWLTCLRCVTVSTLRSSILSAVQPRILSPCNLLKKHKAITRDKQSKAAYTLSFLFCFISIYLSKAFADSFILHLVRDMTQNKSEKLRENHLASQQMGHSNNSDTLPKSSQEWCCYMYLLIFLSDRAHFPQAILQKFLLSWCNEYKNRTITCKCIILNYRTMFINTLVIILFINNITIF